MGRGHRDSQLQLTARVGVDELTTICHLILEKHLEA